MKCTIFAVLATFADAAIVDTSAKNINVVALAARVEDWTTPAVPVVPFEFPLCDRAIENAWTQRLLDAAFFCGDTWPRYETEVDEYIQSAENLLCGSRRSSLVESLATISDPPKVSSLLQTNAPATPPKRPNAFYDDDCLATTQKDWTTYENEVQAFCKADGEFGMAITDDVKAYMGYVTKHSCSWPPLPTTCNSMMTADGSQQMCDCNEDSCTVKPDPAVYALDSSFTPCCTAT